VDLLTESDRELARKLTPAEKLAQALELMETGIRLKRSALRQSHPEASPEAIEKMLADWLAAEDV
jgi:hypothetical protein